MLNSKLILSHFLLLWYCNHILFLYVYYNPHIIIIFALNTQNLSRSLKAMRKKAFIFTLIFTSSNALYSFVWIQIHI